MENLNQQLLDAAIAFDLSAVEKLAAKGADINYTEPGGNCAVFTAAWEGNIPALELYLRLGAAVNSEENNFLCNAAYNGRLQSVQWLLQHGALPNFSFAATGENALHYTISKTSEMDERTEIVRLLVNAGTEVNKTTIKGAETLCFMRDAFLKGETALHRAAAYGNEAMIKILLDAGANPSAKDANGDTPISWGSWHLRDDSVLKLLLYEGVARIR